MLFLNIWRASERGFHAAEIAGGSEAEPSKADTLSYTFTYQQRRKGARRPTFTTYT